MYRDRSGVENSRRHGARVAWGLLLLASAACSASEQRDGTASGLEDTNIAEASGGNDATSSEANDGSSEGGVLDTIEGTGNCNGDVCPELIDILFVIDNSGSTGEEQLNLAKNFPLLIQELENLRDGDGQVVGADVNVMVTTSDFANTYCSETTPERGSPVATGCNSRLENFSTPGLPGAPNFEASCKSVCETDVVPDGSFIHFRPGEHNIVGDVTAKDVNGDGIEDGPVAQALACIGPQGIDGCGFESPLEAMLHALNPDSEWNQGDHPFLRHSATLAVVLITDEADCSVEDWTIMDDEGLMNLHPDRGQRVRSSAICWNAGVECDGPDAQNQYTNCRARDDGGLHPISRYTRRLVNQLVERDGKEVVMLGILGVPPVREHNPQPPHEPTAGGVLDLVYRDWKDPEYPAGDILPSDWPDRNAEFKRWEFGIGPGCTGTDTEGSFTGQAVPPVRIKEVCESLNKEDKIRCCIESICDDDFSAAIGCLTDVIQATVAVG